MSNIRLIIPLDSYRQMLAYIDTAEGEITWFFDVEYSLEKRAFVVGNVYLIPQEATGGSVEMSDKSLDNLIQWVLDNDLPRCPAGWGHSHVNMGAFFSGTDENAINNEFQATPFAVALVMNKRREYEAIVQFNQPDFNARFRLELEVDFDAPTPQEYIDEVKEKVTKITYEQKNKFQSNKLAKRKKYQSRICTLCWTVELLHHDKMDCPEPYYEKVTQVGSDYES